MERDLGVGFSGEGTHVSLWLIHADIWQKPTQYYKATILQLERERKKEESSEKLATNEFPQSYT